MNTYIFMSVLWGMQMSTILYPMPFFLQYNHVLLSEIYSPYLHVPSSHHITPATVAIIWWHPCFLLWMIMSLCVHVSPWWSVGCAQLCAVYDGVWVATHCTVSVQNVTLVLPFVYIKAMLTYLCANSLACLNLENCSVNHHYCHFPALMFVIKCNTKCYSLIHNPQSDRVFVVFVQYSLSVFVCIYTSYVHQYVEWYIVLQYFWYICKGH